VLSSSSRSCGSPSQVQDLYVFFPLFLRVPAAIPGRIHPCRSRHFLTPQRWQGFSSAFLPPPFPPSFWPHSRGPWDTFLSRLERRSVICLTRSDLLDDPLLSPPLLSSPPFSMHHPSSRSNACTPRRTPDVVTGSFLLFSSFWIGWQPYWLERIFSLPGASLMDPPVLLSPLPSVAKDRSPLFSATGRTSLPFPPLPPFFATTRTQNRTGRHYPETDEEDVRCPLLPISLPHEGVQLRTVRARPRRATVRAAA